MLTDVAPDVRCRSYMIEADIDPDGMQTEGVLIAHGDATSAYSLFIKGIWLVQDLNVGGAHHVPTLDRELPIDARRLGVKVTRWTPEGLPRKSLVTVYNRLTLLIDGEPDGSLQTPPGFANLISRSGLNIGRDRGSLVSHHTAPFVFTRRLLRVRVTMHGDQGLVGGGDTEMARH